MVALASAEPVGVAEAARARHSGKPRKAVGAVYHSAMPTPVTGRWNLHTATTYGQPLGVRAGLASVACWCRSTRSARAAAT